MVTLASPRSRPLRWGRSEIFGSILFFGLLAGNTIAGRVQYAVLLPASGDLIFVFLFFEFLLNGRTSSR